MILQIKRGDIFKADVEAIVNTVNCVGVMGKGLALEFKKRFPSNFRQYEKMCKAGEIVPGKMFIFDLMVDYNPRYIINFPTKRHWRDSSNIKDIEDGLISLEKDIRAYDIKSIAIPALGCGLGGLEWDDVYTLIEEILGEMSKEVSIYVYPPR